MGKYTYLLSLPARHRGGLVSGHPPTAEPRRRQSSGAHYTPQIGHDLEAGEPVVMVPGKKAWSP